MKEFSLLRCNNCGIVKTIAKFDDSQYESEQELEMQFKLQKNSFEQYARNVSWYFPIKSGRLLDVGCGLGWLVVLAKKMGFDAQGIDSGKACISVGKKYLKANAKLVELCKYRPKEKFDLIVANHVLEHSNNPISFLEDVKRVLKRGGWVLIICPNFDSLMRWLFQERWYGLVPKQHRYQYSPKSLKYLLEKNGFKIHKMVVNNLDYQVKGWKGFVFNYLLKIATITNTGDQVIVLAKYEG